jgi:hypothetical protein
MVRADHEGIVNARARVLYVNLIITTDDTYPGYVKNRTKNQHDQGDGKQYFESMRIQHHLWLQRWQIAMLN